MSLVDVPQDDRRILAICFFVGALLELLLLTCAGFNGHWLAHPQKASSDDRYLEAQIFTLPRRAQLVEPPKRVASPAHRETTLSKVAKQGQTEPVGQREEHNQTQSGAPAEASHGPIAIFAPAPKIPSYLQDMDLNASVVIDFFVSSLGVTSVRLVHSSGNEELDALALKTTQTWQFRAAEREHQTIDAKVRLRIVFEVN